MDIISQSRTLSRKEHGINTFLSNDTHIQTLIDNPSTEAISFGFPISALVKTHHTQPYGLGYHYQPLYRYCLTKDGFKEWCP